MCTVGALMASAHSSVSSAEAPESCSTLIFRSIIAFMCSALSLTAATEMRVKWCAANFFGARLCFEYRVRSRPFVFDKYCPRLDVGHKLWATSPVDLDDGE